MDYFISLLKHGKKEADNTIGFIYTGIFNGRYKKKCQYHNDK